MSLIRAVPFFGGAKKVSARLLVDKPEETVVRCSSETGGDEVGSPSSKTLSETDKKGRRSETYEEGRLPVASSETPVVEACVGVLTHDALAAVFSYLSPADLFEVSQVCTQWHTASQATELWKTLAFSKAGVERGEVLRLCNECFLAEQIGFRDATVDSELVWGLGLALRGLLCLVLDGGGIHANIFPTLQDSCPHLQCLYVYEEPVDKLPVAICHPKLEVLEIVVRDLGALHVQTPELRSMRLYMEERDPVFEWLSDEDDEDDDRRSLWLQARKLHLGKLLRQGSKLVSVEIDGMEDMSLHHLEPIRSIQKLILRSCENFLFCFPDLRQLDAWDCSGVMLYSEKLEPFIPMTARFINCTFCEMAVYTSIEGQVLPYFRELTAGVA